MLHKTQGNGCEISKGMEESSSEEEDEKILDSLYKTYSTIGGNKEDLNRVQNFLFQPGSTTCLICISSVKRSEKLWSCGKCYAPFHVGCINNWASGGARFHELDEHTRKFNWPCPKCRHEYSQDVLPLEYYCFCGSVKDPPVHPWNVPHSCGDLCKHTLRPDCGHVCSIICHPGPCPPCPRTVMTSCFCGKSPVTGKRCCDKGWSCNKKCGKDLKCNLHKCDNICHDGDCPPCSNIVVRSCICGFKEESRICSSSTWLCAKVCGKNLLCGHHKCNLVCHRGECPSCPNSGVRTCPCGKSVIENLPCTESTPTCDNTCDKLLTCGVHRCMGLCHTGPCGKCLERTVKPCRCGQYTKEMPCLKEFLCDSKCKRMRDCGKHLCNRRCCEGSCGPCEKVCGRTLSCGNHKCMSTCHRSFCLPCGVTYKLRCACRSVSIEVPCGKKKKRKSPKCTKLCNIRPKCYHKEREPHTCHYGLCPPCKQICNLKYEKCGHLCQRICHVNSKEDDKITQAELICGPCETLVTVRCLGRHIEKELYCHLVKEFACNRGCGRMLSCSNHTCKLRCHQIEKEDVSCYECKEVCNKRREGLCTHLCKSKCHPGECPKCDIPIQMRCHCSLSPIMVTCQEWISSDEKGKESLRSCLIPCPKIISCGHTCSYVCHSGPCSEANECKRKVKLFCKCNRIKKEFKCASARNIGHYLPCDQQCYEEKEQQEQVLMEKERIKKIEEEYKNRTELEKFEKRHSRKKEKHKKVTKREEKSIFEKMLSYKIFFTFLVFILISFIVFIFYYLFTF